MSPRSMHGLIRKNTDMINASNPQYTALRNAAIREGDLMHQCVTTIKAAN